MLWDMQSTENQSEYRKPAGKGMKTRVFSLLRCTDPALGSLFWNHIQLLSGPSGRDSPIGGWLMKPKLHFFTSGSVRKCLPLHLSVLLQAKKHALLHLKEHARTHTHTHAITPIQAQSSEEIWQSFLFCCWFWDLFSWGLAWASQLVMALNFWSSHFCLQSDAIQVWTTMLGFWGAEERGGGFMCAR